jgi:hypothetical protein
MSSKETVAVAQEFVARVAFPASGITGDELVQRVAALLDRIEGEARDKALEEAAQHVFHFYPLVEQFGCSCGLKFMNKRKEVEEWQKHVRTLKSSGKVAG